MSALFIILALLAVVVIVLTAVGRVSVTYGLLLVIVLVLLGVVLGAF